MKARLLGALALALTTGAAAGETPKAVAPPKRPSVQTRHKIETKVTYGSRRGTPRTTRTVQMGYLLFLPKGCKAGHAGEKRWPLMLFLHGAGERGDNLAMVRKHGPPKRVETDPNFPFLLVSPQCPRSAWWSPEPLMPLLDHLVATYPVDTDRIYVTGLSMGGFGTWALAIRQPKRFAAIVPICGGGDPSKAAAIKDVPTWVFHGGKDRVVPPNRSRQMVEAMKQAGAKDVKLTVYPDAGHDSWTKTYNNPELYTWLLKHSLKDRKKPRPAAKPGELKTRT
jgi:predicted peptidase